MTLGMTVLIMVMINVDEWRSVSKKMIMIHVHFIFRYIQSMAKVPHMSRCTVFLEFINATHDDANVLVK